MFRPNQEDIRSSKEKTLLEAASITARWCARVSLLELIERASCFPKQGQEPGILIALVLGPLMRVVSEALDKEFKTPFSGDCHEHHEHKEKSES